MQLATTLQFRKAVRKYAAKKNLHISGSFTNQGSRGQRTVGFDIANATPKIAEKIEKKLNKKGLTAKTRCTGAGYSTSPSGFPCSGSFRYIRGTCLFVD